MNSNYLTLCLTLLSPTFNIISVQLTLTLSASSAQHERPFIRIRKLVVKKRGAESLSPGKEFLEADSQSAADDNHFSFLLILRVNRTPDSIEQTFN